MIKRILVGLGAESTGGATIQCALALAQRHQARLTAATIVDVDRLGRVGAMPLGGSGAAQELREHRLAEAHLASEHLIAEFKAACTAAGVDHIVHQDDGHPIELMIAYARYHDLVVCSLQGLFSHGVVDEPHDEFIQLVTSGVRPIVVVPAEFRPVQRVLLTYSGSIESAKAIKRFVQLLPWAPAALRVVTFQRPPEEAATMLEEVTDYCRVHGLTVEVDAPADSPREHLLPYAAKWNADLIVMGGSVRRLLLRKLMGDTVLHALQHADRTLFLCQ